MTALPVQLTSFVGRHAEIEQVQHLLKSTRLLTLTGPGGVGKTRLAVATVSGTVEHFPDGISFVPLGTIADPDLVVPTIATSLGLKESGARSTHEMLAMFLGDRQTLVVLDNFERVVISALKIVDLLTTCPHLRFLVTSRIPLRISGEQELPVPPLTVPDAQAPLVLDDLMRYDAVELFVQRARESRPNFQMTASNASAVVEICHRLDGLPLAIELAAARTRLLTPQALLERLDHRLALLTGGAHNLPSRQQTMRATIAWSYDLLTPDAQHLFRQLTVFAGGWTLDAAAAVCELDEDVLDRMTTLVDHNLVRQVARPDGSVRFTMLETIREFGQEELARTGDEQITRDRHAHYFVALAERIGPQVVEPDPWFSLQQLEAEHANLRGALEWLAQQDTGELVLRLATAMQWFWWLNGYLSEGRRWLEWALNNAPAAPFEIQARALLGAGTLSWGQGDYDRTVACAETSLSLCHGTEERWSTAYSLALLGMVALQHGDLLRATDQLEQARDLYNQIGDQVWLPTTLTLLGNIAYQQRAFDRAESLFQEALTLERAVSHELGIAITLMTLAQVVRDRGDWKRALTLFRESFTVFADMKNTWGTGSLIAGVATIAAEHNELQLAARLCGAVRRLCQMNAAELMPAVVADLDRATTAARSGLGDTPFAASWEEGYAGSLEVAVAEAVLFIDTVTSPLGDGSSGEEFARLLTSREIEVLRLVAEGKSNQEIAIALGISPHTAANHVAHILNKLDLESRTAAASWAIRQGLFS
jgi:non-specific serine/threonine protein kinase